MENFDPSSVVANIRLDINGNVEMEPVVKTLKELIGGEGNPKNPGKSKTKVYWYEYEKKTCTARFCYITSAGDRKCIKIG